jgi:hypothetical protein
MGTGTQQEGAADVPHEPSDGWYTMPADSGMLKARDMACNASGTSPASKQTTETQPKEAGGEACKQDWRECKDNSDVVETSKKARDAAAFDCKQAATKQTRYGTPDWGWYVFGSYVPGSDAPRTGKLTLVDDNVDVSNQYRAKMHAKIVCEYDLNAKRVRIGEK